MFSMATPPLLTQGCDLVLDQTAAAHRSPTYSMGLKPSRGGKHDDLVLSVAIAIWWCGLVRKRQMRIGTYRGLSEK